MQPLSSKMNSNISNWQTLGEIQTSEKLTITEVNGPGFGKVKIIATTKTFQRLARSLNINPTTITTAKNSIKWIAQFQLKTLEDLASMDEKIDSNPSAKGLKNMDQSLHKLKDAITNSKVGLTHLANTYGESRHYDTELSLKEALEYRILKNSKLFKKIHKLIEKLAQKMIEKEPLVIQTYDSTKPPNLSIDYKSSNYAKKAEKLVQNYVRGIGVKSKATIMRDNAGKTATVPKQFALDLHRVPHFSLNKELIYSNIPPVTLSPVKAFEKIKRALGNSEKATNALTTLTTQGAFGNSLKYVIKLAKKELNLEEVVVAANKSTPYEYNIEIKDDEVKVILKNAYNLTDFNGDSIGFQIAKRELQFSLKELQNLKSSDELQKLDLTKEAPLKTVLVKDIYSQIHFDQTMMEEQYKKF